MASDRDHPQIEWDEKKPAFYVKANDPDARRAGRQFAKKKLYYLGSDNGCGCGFRREDDVMLDDPAEIAVKRENQRRLAAYLTACLKSESPIELFGCWSGDEEEELVRRREVTVAELADDEFFFIEREHILVG